MAERRYYWFKLKDDFFDGVKIKKLRQLAGGDTYTIIYLKMLLKAMKHDGVLEYQGVEGNIYEEIALDIDEKAENVQVALTYLLSKGLAEQIGNDCFLPESVENVGSENSSAQRVREYRNRQKALHCNTDVTQVKRICNAEKEKNIEKIKETDIEEMEMYAPAPQLTVTEYEEYMDLWNSIPHTISINGIIPMSARDNEFRYCLHLYGHDGIVQAMQKVADSEWLRKKGDVSFDRYMNHDVIQKLLEGTYDKDFSKKEESDGYDFFG